MLALLLLRLSSDIWLCLQQCVLIVSQVLLLNGSHDRETSGFAASCFVTAITDALNRTHGDNNNCLENPVSG